MSPFDLIDLEQASTVFRAQIFGSGEIVIDESPNRRMYFHMRVLREYAFLNEVRQEILERRM
jgi:hypothetical protein